MADTNFKGTVEALFQGMDSVISTKTVVSDPIYIGDIILLPLVDVSFGLGAGSGNSDKKGRDGGGLGGKITPCAVLVIQNGKIRLVNIKNQDTITKILDMVPDVVDRFASGKDERVTEKDIADILDSQNEEE